MAHGAEAKVRARLLALLTALETRETDVEIVAGRSRLGAMQHQAHTPTDDRRRLEATRRVRAALERLEDGKYGYCATCGVSIEDARLEADPATVHCAKCGGDQQ